MQKEKKHHRVAHKEIHEAPNGIYVTKAELRKSRIATALLFLLLSGFAFLGRRK